MWFEAGGKDMATDCTSIVEEWRPAEDQTEMLVIIQEAEGKRPTVGGDFHADWEIENSRRVR